MNANGRRRSFLARLGIGAAVVVALSACGNEGSPPATGPEFDLSVGTYLDPTRDQPRTAIAIFPHLPASHVPDGPAQFTVTGPAGWNDGSAYEGTVSVAALERGFSWYSPTEAPAVSGEYDLTLTLDGVTYTDRATADAADVLPAASDIVATDATTSGISVSWSGVPGAESYMPALFESPYVPGASAIEGAFTTDTNAAMEDLSLEPGEYFMTVYAYNVDRTAAGRPEVPDQFNVSLGASGPFTVEQAVALTCTSAEDLVDVPDPYLREGIRDTLGLASDDVTCGDLAGLTELSLDWPEDEFAMTSLEGLQHAPNLEHLDLNGHRAIASIEPLAGLENLRHLGVHGEAWVLEGLTALESLDVAATGLTDLSFLASLPNLRQAFLCCLGLDTTSAEFLRDLTHLESLDVAYNGLDADDLAVLLDYDELTELWIGGSHPSVLELLDDLPPLQALGVGSLGIESLAALPDLTSLVWLDLYENALYDVDALPATLDWVNLERNYLDLTPGSAAMTKIQALQDGDTFVEYATQRPHAHCASALAETTPTLVSVDPQGSFVSTDPETPAATSIDLAGLGLDEGDCLGVHPVGGYHHNEELDSEYGAYSIGIFAGAEGFVAAEGAEPADMPWCEDAIEHHPETFPLSDPGPWYVVVPAGADELLIGPEDCYTLDNHDPQGDYGVLLRY